MDTKALRQKILNLAIHGKLVPQDPNDEPASVLLQRIREEKERLIKEGKIKKGKKSAKTSDTAHYENVPFEVPSGWEWTTLGEISKSILYGVSESAKTTGKYKLLRITDIQDNFVNWSSVPYTDYEETKAEQYLLKDGDILFARTGATVGKSYLVKGITEKAIYASYLIRVQTYNVFLPEYVKYFFESGYYWEQIRVGSVGVGQPNVNGTILSKLNIPIPPIEEQKKIVAELSQWLNLIDIIESGKVKIQAAVRQAKAKILGIAIHGKLVPQDPSDEPASELLRRINPKAEITSDNAQYGNMPKGWCVAKVKDVFVINPKNKINEDIDAGFVPMANISDGFSNQFSYEKKKWRSIKSGFTHFADGDIAVAKISPCLENRKSMVLDNLPNGIGAGTTELHIFRPLCLTQLYGLYFFKSDYFIKQCVGTFNGVVGQQRVGKSIVEDIPFPLPPLAEQHRIVSKIEELFVQLDLIEAALHAK